MIVLPYKLLAVDQSYTIPYFETKPVKWTFAMATRRMAVGTSESFMRHPASDRNVPGFAVRIPKSNDCLAESRRSGTNWELLESIRDKHSPQYPITW